MTELKRLLLSQPTFLSAAAPPSHQLLRDMERLLDVRLGQQLRTYLLTYGCICIGGTEFYGATMRAALRSEIVLHTEFLHSQFAKTNNLVAIEPIRNGQYPLVSSDDSVSFYDPERDVLTASGVDLDTYILGRVRQEISSGTGGDQQY